MSRFGPRTARTFSSLQVPNYRRYFVAQLISVLGNWFQITAQAWLVLELTDSGKSLGITIALQSVPILVLSAYAGVVVDRVDTRRLLLGTQLAFTVVTGTLGILVLTDVVTVQLVYALAFCFGTINAFDRPASQAFLFEMVGPDHIPSAVSLNATTNSAGRMVGPALAGLVIAVAGTGPCFIVNAGSFLLVVAALLRLSVPDLVPRRATTGRPGLVAGLRYVWHEPVLRRTLMAMAVVGCFSYNFQTIMPSMIRFVFERGSGTFGIADGINGGFAVIGALLVGGVRHPTVRMVGVVAVLFGAALTFSSTAPTLAIFMLSMPFFGLAVSAFSTTVQAVLQRSSAPEMQGRVMALFTLALLGTTPVGALISGWLIETYSARVAMGMGAVAALSTGLVLLALPLPKVGRGLDESTEPTPSPTPG